MKQKKYLRLITKTYFEIEDELFHYKYSNGIQGTDQMARLKKQMFIERILRNQKVIEQKHFVTKSEFEKGCYMAVDNLIEHTCFQAFYEINRLGEYLSHLKNNEESNNNEIESLIEKTQKEIDDFDLDSYLSDLSLLESSLKNKMCQNDAMFIQWIFEDFSFENPETKIEIKNNDKGKNEDYKSRPDFKIGIKLANGEAYKLHKEGLSFRKISEQLNFKKSDNNYFSQSIGKASKDPKNIYDKHKLIQQIIQHCKENQIEICSEFFERCIEKYPNEF